MKHCAAWLLAWLGVAPVTAAGIDGAGHWAFQPLAAPAVPATRDTAWPRGGIDRFILARLEQEGMTPAPEAGRLAWLRRVTFDLTGLPPTPDEVDDYLSDRGEDAAARVVDRLLNSPRHGERWAQHWLDLVRYADTHGFEVNTERPNAWPYRDYVIRAFNQDTPYDRFIREQIAGDALGEDAATGFLVTASVLLPGQIGKDEASIRLARQDALDEIVVNVSQSFLGLSIGCARCHDHKSDPVPQEDYYSMQALVAGVEYEDRPMRSAEAEARRREAVPWRQRVQAIDHELGRFVPVARPRTMPSAVSGATGADVTSLTDGDSSGHADGNEDGSGPRRPTVNARVNTDRFAPVRARQLRFSILATNSLEPCLDELEVVTTDGRNAAAAEAGAVLRTSGDTVEPDRHEPRFLNDGRFGNSRSWMSNEAGRGWVEVRFARDEEITRVRWGRDREGVYEDRLATEYRVEVAGADGAWSLVADSSDRRPWIAGTDPGPAFTTDGLGPDEAAAAQRLLDEKHDLESRIATAEAGQLAFAGKFRPPDRIHLLNRGDPEQPRAEVAPATPRVVGRRELAREASDQDRRMALADWIASPANPLTARVMVNRLWQGHFGTGLVETSSDFGLMGTRPSHPELLDWLAAEFLRAGWSLKHMHRLIVLSATYRQAQVSPPAADPAAGAAEPPTPADPRLADAEARLLWRFPRRRLEAEAIRDSMLAVSGRLDRRMFGRGFNLFDVRGGLSGFRPVESFAGDGLRRLIYAHKVRRERDAVFGAFDCPDAGQSAARRRESTTPLQALNLFNSRFTLEAAEGLAARVARDAGPAPADQLALAWRLALGRSPDTDEISQILPVVEAHGLAPVARALFNSNEFLFMP